MARYWRRIEPDPELALAYRDLTLAIRYFEAAGLRAEAAKLRLVLLRLWEDYEKLGARASAKADAFVRSRLRNTQVRPDASGRLRSAIRSRPLPVGAGGLGGLLPAGAIGIVDLDELDRLVVDPDDRQKRPYWRAQEYGTSAHVGRIVPGYFQPGSADPSAAEFRVHPYFKPVFYTRGTPAMLIQRPLRARHFLRDGTADAVVWHRQRSVAINAHALAVLRTV